MLNGRHKTQTNLDGSKLRMLEADIDSDNVVAEGVRLVGFQRRRNGQVRCGIT
jgi:hypothetical protein